MSDRHKIRFGRKFIGGMTPVAVRVQTKLTAFRQALTFCCTPFKIGSRRFRPVGNRLGERSVLRGIGFERTDDIHPVERVQMIEMNDMILHILDAGNEVPDNSCIIGYLIFNAFSTALTEAVA